MENKEKVSPIVLWSTLVSVFLFALGGICVFVFHITLLVNSLLDLPSTVVISKGEYYSLGGGIAMGALLVDGVTVNILKRPLSDHAATLVGRFMIGGLVIMFLAPHLIHYPVADYLENKGYHFCEPASTKWRIFRTIVYTKPGYCVERDDGGPLMDK